MDIISNLACKYLCNACTETCWKICSKRTVAAKKFTYNYKRNFTIHIRKTDTQFLIPWCKKKLLLPSNPLMLISSKKNIFIFLVFILSRKLQYDTLQNLGFFQSSFPLFSVLIFPSLFYLPSFLEPLSISVNPFGLFRSRILP